MRPLIIILLTINFYSANSQDLENLIEKADMLYFSSQLDQALENLLVAEKNGSTSPYVYHRIGMLYIDLYKPNMAVKYLTKTREINNSDSLAIAIHLDFGQAYYMLQKYDQASEEIEQIVNNSDYRDLALAIYLGIYSDTGEFDKAISIAQELLANDPISVAIIGNIGYLFLDMDQFDSAIFYFNRTLELDQNNALAYNNLGNCYLNKGELTKAVNLINKSIELDDKNAYAYRNRGLVYSAMSKPILACSDFDKALVLGYIKLYGDDILKFKEDSCK